LDWFIALSGMALDRREKRSEDRVYVVDGLSSLIERGLSTYYSLGSRYFQNLLEVGGLSCSMEAGYEHVARPALPEAIKRKTK